VPRVAFDHRTHAIERALGRYEAPHLLGQLCLFIGESEIHGRVFPRHFTYCKSLHI
jgi:hypothetical protein